MMKPAVPVTSLSSSDLFAWRQEVERHITPLPAESVVVEQAIGRVTVEAISAARPSPRFAESLRDGFLFFPADFITASQTGLEVCFEVAAGTRDVPELVPGSAQRIFTGGMVCAGWGAVVVPHEFCELRGGRVYPRQLPKNSYIREVGMDSAAGEILFPAGHRLSAEDVVLLVSCGVHTLSVRSRSRVALCCTGSELVAGREPGPGEKVSVNHLFMKAALERFYPRDFSVTLVGDEKEVLASFFSGAIMKNADLILTSGGMGPGRFDLVQEVFAGMGGEIFFDTLAMQPGKSLLFGRLHGAVVLGLPGPPRAVSTLTEELLVPVFRLLEGENSEKCWPTAFAAKLLSSAGSASRFPRLRSGVLSFLQGECFVRPVGKREQAQCHIVFPADRELHSGDLVEVHLLPF
ncbi:molybdopterin molybdotransferase MoeA [Desulforhopalus vacuolatus]|uniref:molybdopterin molybdotransferase MoeA n=1 Tax=Desulforhopalus vacuolatus TaxID=40414 RepID=UPI0019647361|nr:molybdopterin molybdotransferase MoeA [Desulforhopalus vacuolatus]MBM9519347.1 molybdopterin molybdotransferase MoeA [Desulforhopalus vacuolatus]